MAITDADLKFSAIATALELTQSNSEELGDSTPCNDAEVFLLSLRVCGFDVVKKGETPEVALAASAIGSLEASGHWWVLAKGKTQPNEPLYGLMLIKEGTTNDFANVEADTLAEVVRIGLGKAEG